MKKRFYSEFVEEDTMHRPWFQTIKDVKASFQEKIDDRREKRKNYFEAKAEELDKLQESNLYLFVQNRETQKWMLYKAFQIEELEGKPEKIDAFVQNLMTNPRWIDYRFSFDRYWADRSNIRDERIGQMIENMKRKPQSDEKQESLPKRSFNPTDVMELESNIVWGKTRKENTFGFQPYRPVTYEQSFTGKILKAPFQRGLKTSLFHPPFFDYRTRGRMDNQEQEYCEGEDCE